MSARSRDGLLIILNLSTLVNSNFKIFL